MYTAVYEGGIAAMKTIDDVLGELSGGDWRDNIRRAALLARMEDVARRRIAAAGFAEIICRAASCEDGELRLTVADSSACARLRQMQNSLLEEMRREFPMLRNLRFGIQL
ncbi:MAG: DciA family protein [Gammaproteobacteria bacterium]